MDGVTSIVDLAPKNGEVAVTIRRLAEPVQFEPELLQQLQGAGVMPGASAVVSTLGSYVLVQVDGFADALELPVEVATHIYAAS
jgi:DtxR family Mn-dependent transcriptional regulator